MNPGRATPTGARGLDGYQIPSRTTSELAVGFRSRTSTSERLPARHVAYVHVERSTLISDRDGAAARRVLSVIAGQFRFVCFRRAALGPKRLSRLCAWVSHFVGR